MTIATVLGALAVGGCGQSGNRDAVRSVTSRFYAAVAEHDGSLACAQLSDDTIKKLEQDEQAACPKAVGELGLPPSRVVRVEVFVMNAKVDLANGASAFLEDTAGGWRIEALGCRATNGDPREHPLDCAVES